MRRVIVTADQAVTIEEVERPAPAPGEALVRMSAAGLCGSDKHARIGRHPFITRPYAAGHEVIGIVVDVAHDVALYDASAVAVGQRVVVEPTLPCWECKQCHSGRPNLCERLRFFGCGHDQGGLADYFTIPANRLHVIPDLLDDRQACLIEPLATPIHAAHLAGPLDGRAVAIIGGGPIGLLTLVVALHHGARRVVLADRHEAKLQLARDLGATDVVDGRGPDIAGRIRQALGESADVVFDCVTTQSSLDQALALAGKGGTVMVVGVPSEPVSVPLPQVQDQQLRIQGSATYLAQDFRDAMDLLSLGVIRPEAFITATYPLSRVAEAFDALASGEQVKVVVTSQ